MHCVEGLSRLDAERASTCRMLSFGEDRSGLEKLLAWCDADQTLHARGQRHLQVASRCKDQNERNGAVVALKRSQVQKLLAMLRGGAVEPAYGRPGERFDGFACRDLGQA